MAIKSRVKPLGYSALVKSNNSESQAKESSIKPKKKSDKKGWASKLNYDKVYNKKSGPSGKSDGYVSSKTEINESGKTKAKYRKGTKDVKRSRSKGVVTTNSEKTTGRTKESQTTYEMKKKKVRNGKVVQNKRKSITQNRAFRILKKQSKK